MLSSTTNIKITIEYLHWVQSNLQMIQVLPEPWDDAVEVDLPVGTYEFRPYVGLCDNILYNHLEDLDIEYMFQSWSKCVSKMYPCGDREDFIRDANLYLNPKRLELIKHCIKYMQDELEKRDAQED